MTRHYLHWTEFCEVCGERKGSRGQVDHTECRAIIKELHKDDKAHKPCATTLNDRQVDNLVKWVKINESRGDGYD